MLAAKAVYMRSMLRPARCAGNTTPAVVDGTVYFENGETIYALDARTHAMLWSYPASGQRYLSPAVANGVV
jgi:outer membrane protein assembly factor BamB